MAEFKHTVTFTVEADDAQQASNHLHTSLIRAMFPDDIDWQVTFPDAPARRPIQPTRSYVARDGMYARVLNAVPAYNEANRQPAPMLTDDITVTVKAVDCASMRLRTCETCGRKHATFVLVEWLSREWPGITERAAVHPCNLMEWR